MKTNLRTRYQLGLVSFQVLGDAVFCLTGQTVALWLRFFTPLRQLGFASDSATRNLADYLPLLYLGTALLLLTFFYLQLYAPRLLLRRYRALSIIIKGVFFWFCVFLGTSLALKFEPAVSRMFILLSAITTLGFLAGWRYILHLWLSRSSIQGILVQRVAILGWSSEAAQLAAAIIQDPNHTYHVVGLIATPEDAARVRVLNLPHLGEPSELDTLVERRVVDILVVADPLLSREQTLAIAALCERRYVAFKVIPNFFQIFASNLRLQTISGVSLLGIDDLPLDSLANRVVKRLIDIVGGVVGLAASLPIMAVLAILIRRESPGPIIFAQERVGKSGRPFRMWKLRSMVPDAHLADHKSQSTLRNDPRLTRTGAFMRRNNLDELPQFLNVLLGDMSLVGPRPERSYHAEQLSQTIPHYNPRHSVRPGITGWAQVNGLRGDTSLTERVRHDLYYIENWSIWFDLQIMLLTFVRVRNAY